MGESGNGGTLTIKLGREELVIRQRYEVASISNDILIGLWFTVGSVLFFWESLVPLGTACFLLGSVELLVRPGIRLARHMHLQRVRGTAPGTTGDSGQEF